MAVCVLLSAPRLKSVVTIIVQDTTAMNL